MAGVLPFKGILYNTSVARPQDVVAPPYDIITPEVSEDLSGGSPYTIVRIDAGKELEGNGPHENKYARAALYLGDWLRDGILLRSDRPCFYAYEMDYAITGQRKRLLGFFGLLRLEELGRGVYPHERTHQRAREDRLSLLKACKANTSPIFSLYNSPQRKASGVLEAAGGRSPYMEASDSDGAMHRLRLIDDAASIRAITEDLKDKPIFIADGHHRYETALEYKKTVGDERANHVLMFLANIADGGLTILPTHRLVNADGEILKKLGGHFRIEELSPGADMLAAIEGRKNTFGLYLKGGTAPRDMGGTAPRDIGGRYALEYLGGGLPDAHPALRGLDVVILHELVFKGLLGTEDVSYEMDGRKAVSLVEEGVYRACFFLNPTGVRDVEAVALSSERMPPKSTYFYPKLLTGFVINSLTG